MIIPNIYINGLQKPTVPYNYKAINVTLNSLGQIPFII